MSASSLVQTLRVEQTLRASSEPFERRANPASRANPSSLEPNYTAAIRATRSAFSCRGLPAWHAQPLHRLPHLAWASLPICLTLTLKTSCDVAIDTHAEHSLLCILQTTQNMLSNLHGLQAFRPLSHYVCCIMFVGLHYDCSPAHVNSRLVLASSW